jgi:hypothetical protein
MLQLHFLAYSMLVLAARAVTDSSAAVYLQSVDLQRVEALVPLTAATAAVVAAVLAPAAALQTER